MTRMSRSIPALPVASAADAVRFYVDRLGFRLLHEDAGFAVVARDAAEVHLWQADDASWRDRDEVALRAGPVRSGAESFLAGTASCRIEVDEVDGLYRELEAAGVLHPVASGAPSETTYGTREVPALDQDRNLLTFYLWR